MKNLKRIDENFEVNQRPIENNDDDLTYQIFTVNNYGGGEFREYLNYTFDDVVKRFFLSTYEYWFEEMTEDIDTDASFEEILNFVERRIEGNSDDTYAGLCDVIKIYKIVDGRLVSIGPQDWERITYSIASIFNSDRNSHWWEY